MAAKYNTSNTESQYNTNYNYNGRTLGLNDPALGFCFDNSEGNLSSNISIFFIATKPNLTYSTSNFHFQDSMRVLSSDKVVRHM